MEKKDAAQMEEIINFIISEKEMIKRAPDEGGYTRDLIATGVAIYTKIAWRSGFSLKIKSPYIPIEWLAVEPLSNYDIIYDF